MNDLTPMGKIEMIQRSQRCFMYGLIGLLPLIGIPMMFRAAVEYFRVKKSWPGQWNPASRYLFWGMVCVRVVCATLVGISFVVVYIVISALQ